jgi:deoxyribodipyrimidine photo-lyase
MAAIESGKLLPIYILDDENAGDHKMGGASRWWLHHSLNALDDSLNNQLRIFAGDAAKVLPQIVKETGASTVTWTHCYEPWRIQRDKQILSDLNEAGVEVISKNGSLLWKPCDVLKQDGTPYRVFTPFYRKGCLTSKEPNKPIKAPEEISFAPMDMLKHALSISDLGLQSKYWNIKREPNWEPGEKGAQDKLLYFLENGIIGYNEGRNFPAKENSSYLSPHLHFGEISPHQIWYALSFREHLIEKAEDLDQFRMELAWREFSYNLLYHTPKLPQKNLQTKFDVFPWRGDKEALEAWQQGQTGIPLVDAGMRELWQTGVMHNRVRMVAASFLVKNLMINWREGARWFWDCLVDADLANNSASWQWVAGCGADAAPYFRIFNPATQGSRFDPTGDYTRKFVPELANLPDKWLFNPWEAPKEVLDAAGVTLGESYPEPLVDLKTSRQRALDAFSDIKEKQSA